MKRLSKSLFKLLSASYIIALLSLAIAFLSKEQSIANVFGFVGMYGIVVTVYIFFAHLFSLSLLFILRKKN